MAGCSLCAACRGDLPLQCLVHLPGQPSKGVSGPECLGNPSDVEGGCTGGPESWPILAGVPHRQHVGSAGFEAGVCSHHGGTPELGSQHGPDMLIYMYHAAGLQARVQVQWQGAAAPHCRASKQPPCNAAVWRTSTPHHLRCRRQQKPPASLHKTKHTLHVPCLGP